MGGFCQNQRFLWPNIQIRPKTALRKGLRSAMFGRSYLCFSFKFRGALSLGVPHKPP